MIRCFATIFAMLQCGGELLLCRMSKDVMSRFEHQAEALRLLLKGGGPPMCLRAVPSTSESSITLTVSVGGQQILLLTSLWKADHTDGMEQINYLLII